LLLHTASGGIFLPKRIHSVLSVINLKNAFGSADGQAYGHQNPADAEYGSALYPPICITLSR
jgi:hypothetical protein